MSGAAQTGTGPAGGKRGGGLLSPAAARYVLRRFLQAALVMALVMIGSFALIKAAPGDIVDTLAGTSDMSAERMAELRSAYGLDQPVPVQFARYVARLVTLDFGYSPFNNAPVLEVIGKRWPVTAILIAASVTISMLLGTLFGVLAARRAGRATDLGLSSLMLLLYATPSFIIAMLMILIFSIWLNLMPIAGYSTIASGYKGMRYVLDVAWHLAMPVAALCTFYIAIYGRIGRAAMLDVMQLDYIRTARSKGLSESRIIFVHALRNALLPLVTMAGLQISSLVGGAVLIETIFGLNGMGRTAFDAVFQRDTNLLLGVVFVSSLGVVVVNFVIDILYMFLDPRVEIR